MKITFIGGGNMAGAMIGGLIHHGSTPSHICAVETDAMRRQQLAEACGVTVTASIPDGIHGSEIVIFAVKPQQLHAVANQAAQFLQNKLVISIAAGVRASDLSQWLNRHEFVIRAMPNTPALIGEGITGLYALPLVDSRQKEQATTILEAIGTVIWVNEEAQLDAVTALSGSGPAYVFYFLEAMQEAGTQLGLTADTAKQLAMQTFLGATHLAAQSNDTLATLRMKVTSQGGTTEQALLSMEQADIRGAFIRAMHAACDRSRQMGEIFGHT